MIRRLRLKFICVNMLIVTVMMGVIFGLVYHFTQTGLETQSVSMLQSIAAEPFRPNRPGKPPEGVQLPFFMLELDKDGSLTAVGAVSPPGGDLSEPVAQATMRIVKVFWALDSSLAYKRHFPAINWLNSYSLYLDSLKPWFDENLGPEFLEDRASAMSILQSEASLNEIVQLVGKDALSPADQLTLEVARMVREDFLQQNAFADVDSFSGYDRQEKLLAMVLRYDRLCREAISKGAPVAKLFAVPSREKIGRAKSVPAEEYQQVYQQISAEMEQEITAIAEEGGEDA